ncbi:hypothetical protein DSO57_1014970 [Entomophthora muscae]|uniref:Uncharacterized protein n=1 Tax=Entomophthora muscae TaxID=34485 RepID=A0ACC2UE60_9FUNG|nr:hypothetical protein DSO57_1014970 [Entomophthora muscae]
MISSGWNFVKFSEQDCPFCAETEPIWYQLASENPDFSLSHVDCTIEQELCKRESIKNSPSFKLFNEGEVAFVYPGDRNRTVESFKEFIESGMATKPTAELESGSESALDTWTSDSSTGSKKSMKFRDMTSVLTSNNFTLATKEGIWFVLFQAEASKNSFEFAFYHLSSEFTDLHPRYGIRFATVNCTTEKELCTEKDTSDSSSIQVLHLGQHVDKVNNPKSYEVVKTYIREKVYNIKKTLSFPLHHFASQRLPNPDGKLMVLTDGVFDMLTKDGPWFVFFKSSRCLDCRAIESDWEKLAAQSKDSINIAMVQCSTEKALCARLNIATYPYLRFFKDGAVRDYNGPSDMESLSSFASLASRPHIHTVTKDTFPNIQQRESSYFLYTYNDEKDLEALEPIVKGKYLLLDIYAVPAKEYVDTSNVPKTLPHLQVFHDDVSTSSLSVDVHNSAVVQDWLTNVQYSSVTSLDLTNFDLVMEQHERVVLAVIDPLKEKPAIDLFTASSIAYKPNSTQNKPLFALLDGVKWHEYINRVYHKSSSDLPFVAIVNSRQNNFKLGSKDGTPLPFKGELLFQELDQPSAPSLTQQTEQFEVSPTVGILLILLCGLALFLFILYHRRIHQGRAAPSHVYNPLINEE